MRSFWPIFLLEIRAFVRSKSLAFLLVASVAWMLLLPRFLTGDGTLAGARELDLHYALGGVFALTVVSLLASATGSIAHERAAKRLQLTLVRPVPRVLILAAKGAALTFLGAMVLLVSALILAGRTDLAVKSNHVLTPVLPSPREEAKAMYAAYMASPETPEAVKRTKREIVLRLLENRAVDRYETIPTNGVAKWTFALSPFGTSPRYLDIPPRISARFHFSGAFNHRELAVGRLRMGCYVGIVSNVTQSTLAVPLLGLMSNITFPANELSFTNQGTAALQLRPRRDIQLLIPADELGWNLVRTYLELVAILALLVAFGLFLSAAFGRPVALFVALTMLLMGEMSPAVIESYPDELETSVKDRIGLVLTRAVAEVTRPVSSLNPLAKLSQDECVERAEVVRILLLDVVCVPFILFVLSGLILKRKTDEK